MPRTSPNQKTVHINRDMPDKDKKEGNFLLVKQENWYAANKDLGPYGLQLYLYIAGNKDGFDLALSQEAAEEEAGIKKTTFHNYVNIMIEKGYLVQRGEGSNLYDFYEIPQKRKIEKALPPNKQESLQSECGKAPADSDCEFLSLLDEFDDLLGGSDSSQHSKEINNKQDTSLNKIHTDKTFVF